MARGRGPRLCGRRPERRLGRHSEQSWSFAGGLQRGVALGQGGTVGTEDGNQEVSRNLLCLRGDGSLESRFGARLDEHARQALPARSPLNGIIGHCGRVYGQGTFPLFDGGCSSSACCCHRAFFFEFIGAVDELLDGSGFQRVFHAGPEFFPEFSGDAGVRPVAQFRVVQTVHR